MLSQAVWQAVLQYRVQYVTLQMAQQWTTTLVFVVMLSVTAPHLIVYPQKTREVCVIGSRWIPLLKKILNLVCLKIIFAPRSQWWKWFWQQSFFAFFHLSLLCVLLQPVVGAATKRRDTQKHKYRSQTSMKIRCEIRSQVYLAATN